MKLFCFLMCVGSIVALNSVAQCPDRPALQKRIAALKISSVPSAQQLHELLPFSLLVEKCPRKDDTVRMLLLQRIGALEYLTGNFSQAVSYTQSAIGLFHENNGYQDTAFLIKAYNFLQIYYDSLKQVINKMNAIDSCIHYALLTNRLDYDVLYNIWQRASHTLDIGDYKRCINYSSLGEALADRTDDPRDKQIFSTNFFNSRISSLIGMDQLNEAETALHNKIAEMNNAGLATQNGPFYNQLSVISVYRHQYQESLSYLMQSLDCNIKSGYMLQTKETLSNIGFIYLYYLNDPRKALQYFNNATTYRSAIPEEAQYDEIQDANLFDNSAIAYSRMNDYDSAFLYFEKAFDVIGDGMNENTVNNMPQEQFISNPKLVYVTSLIREKGYAYARKYETTKSARSLDEAIRIFKVADRVLNKVKAVQVEQQSKLAWRRDAKKLYEYAISTCYTANKPQDAFYFFERSRAVLLNDQIHQNRSMSSDEINTRSQIEAKLATLQTELANAHAETDEYTNIQKNILFLNQQKDRINATSISTDTGALTYQLFRDNYALSDQTIVELFTGDSAVYVLAINKDNIRLKKIPKSIFDQLSTAFIGFVSDPVRTNMHFDEFVSVSSQLYQLLFENLDKRARLIISPDDYYFPFEALITGIKSRSKPRYLLYDCSVAYTYSAGFLMLDYSSSTSPSFGFLGMAPVNFPTYLNLPALYGSNESLVRIGATFGTSQLVVNNAATKNAFMNQFYKSAVVQLYTHASAAGNAGLPVIYFADSALNLFDLIPVNKPATKLVVLSACETANGKSYKGEGVFSFNRAFAEAGIPTSMVNMWSVDNQSSYKLTELFYKNVANGLSFDEALRKAKIEFIESSDREHSLPYFWAAPVLAGQPSPSTFSRTLVIVAAITIITLIIVSVRYFKRRNFGV